MRTFIPSPFLIPTDFIPFIGGGESARAGKDGQPVALSPRARIGRRSRLLLPLLAAAVTLFSAPLLLAAPALTVQAVSKPAAASTPAHKPVYHRRRPSASHHPVPASHAAQETVKPLPPKPPDWPVNDKAANALVTWDSHGLRIDAANSSLRQILDQVSAATGAKVEGFDADERIFGDYGPGQARDVLSQLLEGTGYNVLIVGDQGQGTPRQIVLSARTNAAPAPAANAAQAADEDSDADDQQPQPQPWGRPGFPPGAMPRSPQQINQELEQRQQELQRQEQMRQRENPQN